MKIIAHRGASAYAPENTLAAFQKALDMGAKAVEFDVQMTADGELIVIHDDFLSRTTNGQGLVIQTDYEVIKTLDAGSWFDPIFKDEKIPLLKEVLILLKDRVEVHLEIKKIAFEKRPIEEAIYQCVKEIGMVDQVIFSSFDHQCLLYLSKTYHVTIGMLTGSSLVEPAGYIKSTGIALSSYNPSAEYVSQSLVAAIHGDGYQVTTYTVNDLWLLDLLEEMGVDGVFSNYPDLLNE